MTAKETSGSEIRSDEGGVRPAPLRSPRRPGLLLHMAILLSIALIPIGVVAVQQTQRASEAAREVYLDALRARTMEVAAPEREGIVSGLGLLRGIADTLAVVDLPLAECSSLMQRLAATNARLIFIGFLEPPGVSRCNNAGDVFDFTSNPASAALFEEPRSNVRYNPAGDVSGKPVVVLSEPVYTPDGAFRGFASLSLPVRTVPEQAAGGGTAAPAVILFNARGEILGSSVRNPEALFPSDRALQDLGLESSGDFTAISLSGEVRDYTVVPIAPGRAFALGTAVARPSTSNASPALPESLALPLLMWLVSMTVALVSIHYLAIQPIRDLGRRMRGFADGRRILQPDALRNAPGEITEIGETFETMARKIIRDEADLQNTLFEREVLLKEVHHRVKNNLQLMSSILNMQARKVESPEARRSLRDVQERLQSLAAIHRNLYQAPALSQVQFDDLLAELVGQLVSLAPERLADNPPELDLADVRLVPDQAAPLAMVAAEMITNALKYVGEDAAGDRRIRVTMKRHEVDEGEEIELSISNTARPGSTGDQPEGLGQRLMGVLTQQLQGSLESDIVDDRYTARIRFPRAGFEADDT